MKKIIKKSNFRILIQENIKVREMLVGLFKPSPSFKINQAVYITEGIKKGFVGIVDEIGIYYPNEWCRNWGYGLFINGGKHLLENNHVECYGSFVDPSQIVACLCEKCGGYLWYDYDFDKFKCKRCGYKVKITNELHPKYIKSELVEVLRQAKVTLEKIEKGIKIKNLTDKDYKKFELILNKATRNELDILYILMRERRR